MRIAERPAGTDKRGGDRSGWTCATIMNAYIANKKTKTIIALVAGCIIVAASFAAGYLFGSLGKINKVQATEMELEPFIEKKLQAEHQSIKLSESGINLDNINIDVMSDKNVKNILLIGQDRRSNQDKSKTTRSDSMMICSINKKTNEIKLVSLMRDMWVAIPDHGSSKLNAAYAWGGMDLLNETITKNFGIEIDGNIEVDFDGFLATIAPLAPLEIDLTEAEADYMINNDLGGQKLTNPLDWDLHEGKNQLNKDQLLKYVRLRYVGNADYERTERQRRVLRLVFTKLKRENLVTQMNIISDVLPYFTTDLSNKDILGYAYYVLTNDVDITDELRIPENGKYTSQWIGGAAALVPDLEANSDSIKNLLYRK